MQLDLSTFWINWNWRNAKKINEKTPPTSTGTKGKPSPKTEGKAAKENTAAAKATVVKTKKPKRGKPVK